MQFILPFALKHLTKDPMKRSVVKLTLICTVYITHMFPLLLANNVWIFLKSSSSEPVCKFSDPEYRNFTCPLFFQVTYMGETLLKQF